MIVLDTHAWVWWLSDPERLSEAARDAIENARASGRLYVSSISVWEVALLVERGRLKLSLNLADWVAHAQSLPFVEYVALDNTIALKSVTLPEPLHRDPADRMIIATALTLGAALITKDLRIQQYPHVQTVW